MEAMNKKKCMNILHFNSLLDGGAAVASRRLHEKLLQCDVASSFAHHPFIGDTGNPTCYKTGLVKHKMFFSLIFEML